MQVRAFVLSMILTALVSFIYIDITNSNRINKESIEETNNVVNIIRKIIDEEDGWISRKNEHCSKFGYWDNFTIEEALICVGMNYLTLKDEKTNTDNIEFSNQKFIYTKNKTKIFIISVDSKTIKILVDLKDTRNNIKDLCLNSIATNIRDMARNKYVIKDNTFDDDKKFYTITLEI